MQNRAKSVSEGFEKFTENLLRESESVHGFLAPNEMKKLELYRKSSRLIPFLTLNADVSGFRKKVYKLYRSRLPHGAVDPHECKRTVR